MNIIPHTVVPPESLESRKAKWREKAFDCPDGREHNYIPSAWSIHPKSKQVTQLLCLKCFHELSTVLTSELKS